MLIFFLDIEDFMNSEIIKGQADADTSTMSNMKSTNGRQPSENTTMPQANVIIGAQKSFTKNTDKVNH